MGERRGRILRFVLVGGINTGVDLAILFVLTWLGTPVLIANIISTSVALGVSFALNRGYTFRSRDRRARQLVVFLVVTLFGLWVLQPAVILLVDLALDLEPSLTLLIGKLAATAVSMTWNYVLYSRVVFPRTQA